MKTSRGTEYFLMYKMIGLGRPVLLNSGGCWKCVEAFLVGGGGQWDGVVGKGLLGFTG